VPGERLDLRDLLPPAEVLGEGAGVVAVAGDERQRTGCGEYRLDGTCCGGDLAWIEDAANARDAVARERGRYLCRNRGRDARVVRVRTLAARSAGRNDSRFGSRRRM
jgi:hypothetical protein